MQDTFTIGDDVVLDMYISNGEWLQAGRMSLEITSAEGTAVYHFVAYDAGFELTGVEKGSFVRVMLTDQRLYPGKYYVKLWLADRAYETLDSIENAFCFTVIEGGTLVTRPLDPSAGIVHEIPEWSLVTDE